MNAQSFKDRLAQLLPDNLRAYLASHTDAHRKFVGPEDSYDLAAASQFNLLTMLGLREEHSVLDIGCGGLRAGRLLICYLQPGRYFGLEPEKWVLEAAIDKEIGRELIRLKRPIFDHNREFKLSVFQKQFDYLLAYSIFSHATQVQIEACLKEARQVMHTGSCFVATFKVGTENYTGDQWIYPGNTAYTLAHMQVLAGAAGLACEPLDWPFRYFDAKQIWVMFTIRP
jgi:cyclopropane fatty-acyl-phospholipid synthase-like methyltransferase